MIERLVGNQFEIYNIPGNLVLYYKLYKRIDMNTQLLKAGDLARTAQVNRETIRFYEKQGLLPKPERSPAGYRLYSKTDLDRLVFIKNAKLLGFSLNEIKELLALADGKITTCEEVREIAQAKLDHISTQISDLTKLTKVLSKLVDQCSRSTSITDCPIIETLSSDKR